MELPILEKKGHGFCIFSNFAHRIQNFGFRKWITLKMQKIERSYWFFPRIFPRPAMSDVSSRCVLGIYYCTDSGFNVVWQVYQEAMYRGQQIILPSELDLVYPPYRATTVQSQTDSSSQQIMKTPLMEHPLHTSRVAVPKSLTLIKLLPLHGIKTMSGNAMQGAHQIRWTFSMGVCKGLVQTNLMMIVNHPPAQDISPVNSINARALSVETAAPLNVLGQA